MERWSNAQHSDTQLLQSLVLTSSGVVTCELFTISINFLAVLAERKKPGCRWKFVRAPSVQVRCYSNCSAAIEHKAGEVSVEKLGVEHWWKNTGKVPAVLLSSDIFHEMKKEDEHMM